MRVTADEYFQLPQTNLPAELIDGEVYQTPAPELEHQRLVLRIATEIQKRIANGEVFVAPVDVYLDDLNIVQPDVLWISENSQCVPVEGKHLRGAPDLVVEVFSPGTALRDKREKFRLYEKRGTREYWMVDPQEQYIEVWLLTERGFARQDVYGPGESFTSPLLGMVDLSAVFPIAKEEN